MGCAREAPATTAVANKAAATRVPARVKTESSAGVADKNKDENRALKPLSGYGR